MLGTVCGGLCDYAIADTLNQQPETDADNDALAGALKQKMGTNRKWQKLGSV